VLAFKKEWADRSPVVIVPTKYYATPTDVFREHGFSVVIWANQILRSAVSGMQETAARLAREQNLFRVEDAIVPVKEVFRLQGEADLEEAEKLYLPKKAKDVRAVVLAASRGSELGSLTSDKPKAMVEVAGQALLSQIVDGYNTMGIKNLTVVRGYRKETVNLPNVSYADNDEFEDTGELYSLQKALDSLKTSSDTVISYGDVLFKKYILQILLESDADFTIVVDINWRESVNRHRFADYVTCSEPYSRRIFGSTVSLADIGSDLPEASVHGEWMGFLKVSEEKWPVLLDAAHAVLAAPGGRTEKMCGLLRELLRRRETIRVLYTTGHWLDIDTVDDILIAGRFA
jgi:phosphoenolpyruvate phosphomutase